MKDFGLEKDSKSKFDLEIFEKNKAKLVLSDMIFMLKFYTDGKEEKG